MMILPLSCAPLKWRLTNKSISIFWQVVTSGNFINRQVCHLEMDPDVSGEFVLDLRESESFWQSAILYRIPNTHKHTVPQINIATYSLNIESLECTSNVHSIL